MKNKLLITFFAIVCAICCAFGFTACDEATPPSVPVTSVTLNKSELTLEIDGEETLTATVVPDNATDKTVTWSVTPTGIVTVDNGKVTAVTTGEATVTATADGKSASCAVTVAAAPVSVAGKTFKCTSAKAEITDANMDPQFADIITSPDNPYIQIYLNCLFAFDTDNKFKIYLRYSGAITDNIESFSGTYNQTGNAVEIVIDQGDGDTSNASITISGDKLTFRMPNYGYDLVMELEQAIISNGT